MSNEPRLLVVDDEAVICQACRRIFVRQGFQVEESTDAREGLHRATEGEYAGILLDIKMPEMDGLQFLEALRERKPDVPVLIMTGYPSVPNAAAAVRLGASDYITKPFTPEEITRSLQRVLAERGANGENRGAAAETGQSRATRGEELFFLDEAWFQREEDGSACIGAVVPRLEGATVESVRLPRIGEVVYQGLPLAAVNVEGRPPVVVPSPVSGVVVAINDALVEDPSALAHDPCRKGWIACICTTRLEEEIKACRARCVVLANADEAWGRQQVEQLESLGCQVRRATSGDELAAAVATPDYDVLVFDAASFGDEGPDLVRRVNQAAPSVKLVVVASTDTHKEAAYREQRIFYYAVEPFADGEIVEILDAAFRRQTATAPKPASHPAPSDSVAGISITNRNRTKVRLVAEPGLLQKDHGIGWQVRQKLGEWMFPVVTTPGKARLSPTDIVKAAGTCDRLMVLMAKDTGRLPGALVRDTKAEFGSVAGEKTSKVTTLEVQPDPNGAGLAGLDERTAAALAGHIAQEMASY